MPLTLYELTGADPEVRFSPHCWKVRMALAHVDMHAHFIPCRFTEKDKIAFSGQKLVPVLVHGDETISGSWHIAKYLHAQKPGAMLFGGSESADALMAFVNHWTDLTLIPHLLRLIALDVHDGLSPDDQAYFRASREERLGMKLEALVSDRPSREAELQTALAPLRRMLLTSPFIAGKTPRYADYCVFGAFMWARCTSPVELLNSDDVLFQWRGRMLGSFDGMARSAKRNALATNNSKRSYA